MLGRRLWPRWCSLLALALVATAATSQDAPQQALQPSAAGASAAAGGAGEPAPASEEALQQVVDQAAEAGALEASNGAATDVAAAQAAAAAGADAKRLNTLYHMAGQTPSPASDAVDVLNAEDTAARDAQQAYRSTPDLNPIPLDRDEPTCDAALPCHECVKSDVCGYVEARLTSGDGSSQLDVSECRPGDERGPFDRKSDNAVDRWHFLVCHCPNDCSERGRCTEQGKCECRKGYTGDDCSQQAKPHTRPAILIPVAFACAVVVVGIFIIGQLSAARCFDYDHETFDAFDEKISFMDAADPKAQAGGDLTLGKPSDVKEGLVHRVRG